MLSSPSIILQEIRCYNCQDLHTLIEEEYDRLDDEPYYCKDCYGKCVYCGHLLGDEIGYHSECFIERDCRCRPEYGINPGGVEFHPEEPGSNLGVYIIPCVRHRVHKTTNDPDCNNQR